MQAYLKALYSAAVAAVAAAGAEYHASNGHIGWAGALYIAGVALSAFGVVWGVPNAQPEPKE